MRMCGHAHHDDMLYLGKDPQPSWDYPPLDRRRATPTASCTSTGRARDPIATYAARLEAEGVIAPGDARSMQARGRGDWSKREARAVIDAPWPEPRTAGVGVFADEPPRAHVEVLDPAIAADRRRPRLRRCRRSKPAPPFDPKGTTFLEAVMLGVGDALRADPRVFVYGEDVGGKYGNAFLLLRPLLEEFGDRIINSPLAEGAVLGVVRRRGARRAAADRRDAVQRLRRHRLQPAREQRGEDPLPLGRRRADGRAHAVGRPAPRRARTTRRTPSRGSTARPG